MKLLQSLCVEGMQLVIEGYPILSEQMDNHSLYVLYM